MFFHQLITRGHHLVLLTSRLLARKLAQCNITKSTTENMGNCMAIHSAVGHQGHQGAAFMQATTRVKHKASSAVSSSVDRTWSKRRKNPAASVARSKCGSKCLNFSDKASKCLVTDSLSMLFLLNDLFLSHSGYGWHFSIFFWRIHHDTSSFYG